MCAEAWNIRNGVRWRNGTARGWHGGIPGFWQRGACGETGMCESMRLARSESASSPSPDEALRDGPLQLQLEEQECMWAEQAQQQQHLLQKQDSGTSGSSGDDTGFRPGLLPSFFVPAPFSPSAGASFFSQLYGPGWTVSGGCGIGSGAPGLPGPGWMQQPGSGSGAPGQLLLQGSPLQQILPGFSEQFLASSAWQHLVQSEGVVVDSMVRSGGGGAAPRAFLKGEGELEGGEGSENSTGSPEFSNRSDIPFEEEEEPTRARSAKKTSPREDPLQRHGDKGLAGKEPGRRKAKRVGARDDESDVDESKDGKKKKKRKRGGVEEAEAVALCSPSALHSGSSSKETSREAVAGAGAGGDGKKNKKERKSASPDQAITWTDESVKFLFRTYDAIHQRLWEESNGQVKYQKKWTPILKAMQERFGKHFSKKQCQSKYWSVRRECTDYRYLSAKIARSEPSWNPSIAGRELLKPKFYDVWYEVSGKNLTPLPRLAAAGAGAGAGYAAGASQDARAIPVVHVLEDEYLNLDSKGDVFGGDPRLEDGGDAFAAAFGRDDILYCANDPGSVKPVEKKTRGISSSLKEMQMLMKAQLEASEKREEAMKYRAELMMDLLTQHMEHVERTGHTGEESRRPQLSVLERVNDKLEKLLEGFSLLNQNIAAVIGFKFSQAQAHAPDNAIK